MRYFFGNLLLFSVLFNSGIVHAAIPIDLRHAPVSILQTLSTPTATTEQVSQETDMNHTTHTRIRQRYAGYPVWGSDAVIHVPQGGNRNNLTTANGWVYQGLDADLQGTPRIVFSSAQAEKALQQAIQQYQQQTGSHDDVIDPQKELIVFIDPEHRAHWAFKVSFTSLSHRMPEKPIYIMDAIRFSIYQSWNNIQTLTNVDGGGYGGNQKIGKIVYDGLPGDYPKLGMQQELKNMRCYLQNSDVTVKDARHEDSIIQFNCGDLGSQHNHVYWDAELDAINGAYSPDNDALYIGSAVKNMYQAWYGIPVLTKNHKPMMLDMVVHKKMDNAYWDGKQMVFGDGGKEFFPLVSLGVGAHEISHGFTEQHANLQYYGESGGLNEAFSDMAAVAAEFYAVGSNHWQIGAEILKAKNQALRYMDDPTKDCVNHQPGNNCSIAKVSDYHNGLDVHFSSGIFNRVFYLIATSNGWNTKKAFDVMVQANAHYWTATATFAEAACGVMQAAKDYQYDVGVVSKAIGAVGIDIKQC